MFRLSLREMFVLIAAVSLAIVSLIFASPAWQAALGLVVTLSAMIALIVSFIDRGARRAFAIGFAVALLGYLIVVLSAQHFNVERFSLGNDGSNQELSVYNSRLPTSVALQSIYAGISRTTNYDATTGQPIPASESGNLQLIGEGFGGIGGGGIADVKVVGGQSVIGGRLIGPGKRAAVYEVKPPRENFMVQGHFWWALLFGYVGGHFGRFVYLRRERDAEQTGR